MKSQMLLLSFLLLFAHSFAQEPRMVAKTKASLTPPEHFKVAEQFYGFIHGESSSTILIQELEGTSYLLLKQGMTPEYFASQGFTYISAEDIITTSGLKGILYRMSFTVQETEFERLMLFAGDYHQTFWLVGNYPSMIKEQMFETMKNSLLTLKP